MEEIIISKSDFKSALDISRGTYEMLSKTKLYGNELIMCKIGSAGKIYLMPEIGKPATLARNAFMMRFDENKINMIYLCLH